MLHEQSQSLVCGIPCSSVVGANADTPTNSLDDKGSLRDHHLTLPAAVKAYEVDMAGNPNDKARWIPKGVEGTVESASMLNRILSCLDCNGLSET